MHWREPNKSYRIVLTIVPVFLAAISDGGLAMTVLATGMSAATFSVASWMVVVDRGDSASAWARVAEVVGWSKQ